MYNCKEYEQDVTSIAAVPVGNISYNDARMLSATVGESVLASDMTGAIVIGQAPFITGASTVQMVKGTGKVSDSENTELAGRKHTVTVSCEVDSRDTGMWPLLRKLERTPRHLIVFFHGSSRSFVAATEDTYHFEVSREESKVSIRFQIENLAGAQPILD